MESALPEKFKAVNEGLEGEYVLVHVNTSDELLVVPEHLKAKSSVTLKLSRWFRGSLALEEDRVEADLLFSGSYFTCSIPLRAIWAVTTAEGKQALWPESAPPEELISLLTPQLYAEAKERKDKREQTKKEPEPETKPMPAKAHLRRVK